VRKSPALCLLIALSLFVLPGTGARAQGAGQQVGQNFEKQVTKTLAAKYLLYLPNDFGKEADRKWPLILFLHGSGESGDDLEKVKKHGPPKLIAAGKELPFVVVSPQSPGGGWNTEVLGALLDELIPKLHIDEDRVYLTGLSMGGYGTWDMAMAYPNRFAAIAPICGGGTPAKARRIRSLPAWIFHGAKDTTVPVKYGQEMYDAMKAAGADVKITIYPEAGHDSWTETYENKDLYTWFLDHKRGAKPAETGK
jgi:predicted peptidase